MLSTSMLQRGPRTFFAAPYSVDCEDPYPSLSDYHDYEPNLEFDDSDLQQHDDHDQHSIDQDQHEDAEVLDRLPAQSVDGTIEEDFETALAQSDMASAAVSANTADEEEEEDEQQDNFDDMRARGIVEVVGDDVGGRKIIVISACRLPSNKSFDHDRFLQYLTHTLDAYVWQDYSLVYFHHGLTSRNKPPLRWLWEVYKALDRKYKKNLKSLYLVHPTNFIRVVWNFFRPVISAKFGRKVQYVNYLSELSSLVDLTRLPIPKQVLEHDAKLTRSLRGSSGQTTVDGGAGPQLRTQQFGASLQFISEQTGSSVAPIVRQCIDFLANPDHMETEGLFRRSANATLVKELQLKINQGETIVFADANDVHVAAVLLKTFLRDLREPLLTFALFDVALNLDKVGSEQRLEHVCVALQRELPEENRDTLVALLEFLAKVMDRSCWNKMNANNLAVVFGPNLVWAKDHSLNLSHIGPINAFTEFLLTNHEHIVNTI